MIRLNTQCIHLPRLPTFSLIQSITMPMVANVNGIMTAHHIQKYLPVIADADEAFQSSNGIEKKL